MVGIVLSTTWRISTVFEIFWTVSICLCAVGCTAGVITTLSDCRKLTLKHWQEACQVRNLRDTTPTRIHGMRKGTAANTGFERAITASTLVNQQRIKLMSVYFSHSVYADHHIEKLYRTMEKHTRSNKKSIQLVRGDFNTSLGPRHGVDRASGGPHTQ